uniref:Uncharacterized protein n=1 Tax=Rhizophora mucronata TaxID=61149 RepID=A0A2P2NXQ7_RHIMU
MGVSHLLKQMAP